MTTTNVKNESSETPTQATQNVPTPEMTATDVNNESSKTPTQVTQDMPTPNEAASAITMEQVIDKKIARLNQAHNTVKRYAIGSMAIGLVPVPVLDIAVLTGVHVKMLHSLAKQYEIEFSRDLAKSLTASLLGAVIPVASATSIAKVVPLIGQATGIVSMVILGGASTYAVGKVFIEHFESGGTFLTFNPEISRDKFQALFEEGKQFGTR